MVNAGVCFEVHALYTLPFPNHNKIKTLYPGFLSKNDGSPVLAQGSFAEVSVLNSQSSGNGGHVVGSVAVLV